MDAYAFLLGENTPNLIEIGLPPRLEAILAGEPAAAADQRPAR